MEKSTLTIHLPKEYYEKIKIDAVKNNMPFSDIITACALLFIDSSSYNPKKPKKQNDTKVFMQLLEKDKKKIKKAVAENQTTISNFICQALDYYINNKPIIELSRFKKDKVNRNKASTKNKKKPNPFTYQLTEENDKKLRLLSIETGKTRSQLILEAIKKINRYSPNDFSAKTVRSSMNLEEKDFLMIKNKAEKNNISVAELINQAVKHYDT